MAYLHDSLVASKIQQVKRVRRLPLPGEILVELGATVDPDTPVARIPLKPGIPWVIPLARLLGVPSEELSACMLCQRGESVKTKQIIARANETGTYGRKEYESPINGTIEDISAASGRVVIREEFGKEEPPVSLDAAFDLGVKPAEVAKYMLRQVGEEVKKSQIIAKKGEAAAFYSKVAVAPISGVITEINPQNGKVTISRPFRQVVVKGYLDGNVTEVLPKRGVVVETPAVVINGIFGVGGETHGEIKVVVMSPDQSLTAELITAEHAGKIIVGGSSATNEALQKALSLGVKGVICASASYINLVRSLGCKLGVGITGQENIPMTVILLEGFGQLSMREDMFALLKAMEGSRASINGATQIRAGAIRPEIVVPFPAWDGPLNKPTVADEDLAVGTSVRCVMAPYFGRFGTIKEIIRESQPRETEARVPVVKVELDDGQMVTVARANVELV